MEQYVQINLSRNINGSIILDSTVVGLDSIPRQREKLVCDLASMCLMHNLSGIRVYLDPVSTADAE